MLNERDRGISAAPTHGKADCLGGLSIFPSLALAAVLFSAWFGPAFACMAPEAPREAVMQWPTKLDDWIVLKPGGRLEVNAVPKDLVVRAGSGLEVLQGPGDGRLVIGVRSNTAGEVADLALEADGRRWKGRIAVQERAVKSPTLIDLGSASWTWPAKRFELRPGDLFEIVVQSESDVVSLLEGKGSVELKPQWRAFDPNRKEFRAVYSSHFAGASRGDTVTFAVRRGKSSSYEFQVLLMPVPRC